MGCNWSSLDDASQSTGQTGELGGIGCGDGDTHSFPGTNVECFSYLIILFTILDSLCKFLSHLLFILWIENKCYYIYSNPFTSSGLFYHNSLDWSISNSRVSGKFLLLLCFIEIPVFNANSVDCDQSPHSVVSDLGLQCLPITLLGVSRLKWVKHRDRSRKTVCVEILRPSQPNGFMSSAVSLPNHTFTGQA